MWSFWVGLDFVLGLIVSVWITLGSFCLGGFGLARALFVVSDFGVMWFGLVWFGSCSGLGLVWSGAEARSAL